MSSNTHRPQCLQAAQRNGLLAHAPLEEGGDPPRSAFLVYQCPGVSRQQSCEGERENVRHLPVSDWHFYGSVDRGDAQRALIPHCGGLQTPQNVDTRHCMGIMGSTSSAARIYITVPQICLL